MSPIPVEASERGRSRAACAQAGSESAPAMGLMLLVDFIFECRLFGRGGDCLWLRMDGVEKGIKERSPNGQI